MLRKGQPQPQSVHVLLQDVLDLHVQVCHIVLLLSVSKKYVLQEDHLLVKTLDSVLKHLILLQ